jgi:hypothetical protein
MNKYKVIGRVFLLLLAGWVHPATVDDIGVTVTDAGVIVSVSTNAANYREVQVPPPPRIVIDFLGSEYRAGKGKIGVGKGDLIAVRAGQFESGITRVVLDLKRKRTYNIRKTKNGFEILLPGEKKAAAVKEEKKREIIEIKKKPQEEKRFSYLVRGKRDPFKPLVGWATEEDTLLDVRNAQVVGIVWTPEERYALVQARNGEVYIVEEGDRIRGGRVSKIREKDVVFTLWELGRTERLTLRIRQKEQK